MTANDSEMNDLVALAARLGRDPLAIQGPGGNISLKREGVMWVKASGTWMMEPTEIITARDMAQESGISASCTTDKVHYHILNARNPKEQSCIMHL